MASEYAILHLSTVLQLLDNQLYAVKVKSTTLSRKSW